MSKSNLKFVSPKGTASYPWLTKPDTKFSAEGSYKTGLVLSAEEAKPLQDAIKAAFVDEFGQSKMAKAHMPWKEGEEGLVTFNFKSKLKPRLFDSAGKAIMGDPKVGAGSVIKVSGAYGPYNKGVNMGVALYLNAVQIIDLVEFSASPFGAEQGGYVADDEPVSETASSEEDEVNF